LGFTLASPEQKIEIVTKGQDMFNSLNARKEANVVEFLQTLEQVTSLIAMNWEGRKVPEETLLDIFRQKAETLLSALA